MGRITFDVKSDFKLKIELNAVKEGKTIKKYCSDIIENFIAGNKQVINFEGLKKEIEKQIKDLRTNQEQIVCEKQKDDFFLNFLEIVNLQGQRDMLKLLIKMKEGLKND